MKKQNTPFFATLIVAGLSCAVALMTIEGAYALTGKWLLAFVFGSCVFVQWMAARSAFRHFAAMARESSGRTRNAFAGAFGLGLWFLTATFTVSLLGSELGSLITAKDLGSKRFDDEQARVNQHVNLLVTNLDGVKSGLEAFAAHADQMAKIEAESGSSCMVGTAKGYGPVAAFRNSDKSLAESLNTQVTPTLGAMKSELSSLGAMKFELTAVNQLGSQLQLQIDKVNAIRSAPVLGAIKAASEQRIADAKSIQYQGATFVCQDSARESLLKQLISAVDSVQAQKALESVALMDPLNSKALATASLLRTWSGVTGFLPASVRVPVSDDLKRRFSIDEKKMELSPSNMGNVLAWVIEFMLLAALFYGVGSGDNAKAEPDKVVLGPVTQRLIDGFATKTPFGADVVEAVIRKVTAHVSPKSEPYVNAGAIFADGDMQARVTPLVGYYRPYGKVDLLVIPVGDIPAVKAARELELQRLLSRKASALSREALGRDPRFRAVIDAIDVVNQGPFAVFHVVSADLLRFILTADWKLRRSATQSSATQREANS